jgi:hypothetical protein
MAPHPNPVMKMGTQVRDFSSVGVRQGRWETFPLRGARGQNARSFAANPVNAYEIHRRLLGGGGAGAQEVPKEASH